MKKIKLIKIVRQTVGNDEGGIALCIYFGNSHALNLAGNAIYFCCSVWIAGGGAASHDTLSKRAANITKWMII